MINVISACLLGKDFFFDHLSSRLNEKFLCINAFWGKLKISSRTYFAWSDLPRSMTIFDHSEYLNFVDVTDYDAWLSQKKFVSIAFKDLITSFSSLIVLGSPLKLKTPLPSPQPPVFIPQRSAEFYTPFSLDYLRHPWNTFLTSITGKWILSAQCSIETHCFSEECAEYTNSLFLKGREVSNHLQKKHFPTFSFL